MLVRLLPVLFVTAAASFWFNDIQDGGPFVLRNLLPLAVLTLLAIITLWRGDGMWAGSGWRLPLGVLGFTIPALGLSLYLHYAYSVNLNGMFSEATDSGQSPGQLFRYLPIYTLVAGGIGFAIGWIVGKNV